MILPSRGSGRTPPVSVLQEGRQRSGRQCDQAPAASPVGSLVQVLAASVQHDLVRLEPDATPDQGQLRVRREGDEDQIRGQGDIGDARQRFAHLEKTHAPKLGPVHVRDERARTNQREFGEYVREARLEFVGIGEGVCRTARHFRPASATGFCAARLRRLGTRQVVHYVISEASMRFSCSHAAGAASSAARCSVADGSSPNRFR